MAKIIPLDKILEYGVSYRSHPRACYKITKIGTNATSSVNLKVENRSLGPVISDIAPEFKTSSYIIGPLELADFFYFIPPDTDFSVEGSSGDRLHIIGDIILLDPGEGIPAELMERYRVQDKHYIPYVTGSYSFGTDVAWGAGNEVELYTLTPSTIERYVFNNIIMIDYANITISPGDVVINFYLDNTPLEFLESTNLDKGIDIYALPHRDDVSSNEEPFSLKNYPIEVLGDHTLKVTAKNVSGSDITPPTGTSITLTFYAVVEYHKG